MINVEKGGCETCAHSSVCKYRSDFKDLIDRAGKLLSVINSENYELSARCKKHERRIAERRNNRWSRTRRDGRQRK